MHVPLYSMDNDPQVYMKWHFETMAGQKNHYCWFELVRLNTSYRTNYRMNTYFKWHTVWVLSLQNCWSIKLLNKQAESITDSIQSEILSDLLNGQKGKVYSQRIMRITMKWSFYNPLVCPPFFLSFLSLFPLLCLCLWDCPSRHHKNAFPWMYGACYKLTIIGIIIISLPSFCWWKVILKVPNLSPFFCSLYVGSRFMKYLTVWKSYYSETLGERPVWWQDHFWRNLSLHIFTCKKMTL